MTPGRPLRLRVEDDAEIIVQGLARMLEPYSDRIELLDAARPGKDADDGTSTGPAADGLPPSDIVLVDASPGAGQDADLPAVLARTRSQRVVAWSWSPQDRLVTAALDAGASGYLAKTLGAEDLVEALERLHRGETVVTPMPPRPATDPEQWPGRDHGLTARESEIVAHITRGLSNQQIADRAFLSINSVKSYIRSSYRKMGVTSRSRAVLWGIEHGFRAS